MAAEQGKILHLAGNYLHHLVCRFIISNNQIKMKFTVDWAENKTAKTGKPYKSLTIKGDDGKPVNVNIFSDWPDFANIAPGSQIDGELEQNGKYINIKSNAIKERKPSMDRLMDKKVASIAEFQASKSQSISQAQDRTALMWAKNNASELVAHHPVYKNLKDEVEVEMAIEALASKILHMDLTPF